VNVLAVSLFSGAGGFCEGARLAGWDVIYAVESNTQACLTHAANFGEVPLFKGNIAGFLQDAPAGAPSVDELVARHIDVVFGGPPCQGFSQIGPRNVDDPRNRLYEEFVRVVQLLQPRAFVMENVPNMMPMQNGHFRTKIVHAFREAGYSRTAILPVVASDFGVPQHRRRVFVFGIRDRLPFTGNFAETAHALLEREKAKGHDYGGREWGKARRRKARKKCLDYWLCWAVWLVSSRARHSLGGILPPLEACITPESRLVEPHVVEPSGDSWTPERQFDSRCSGGNVIRFQFRSEIRNLAKGAPITNNEV